MMLTFNLYLLTVANAMREHKDWRAGQTYFNILFEVRPKLASEIRGCPFDPYYSDSEIPDFLAHVAIHWERGD